MEHQRSDSRRIATGVVTPSHVSAAVKDRIARDGEGAVAEELELGRPTVARLAGSLTCRRATIEYVAHRLGLNGDDFDGGR